MVKGSFELNWSNSSGSHLEGLIEWESVAVAEQNKSNVTASIYVRKKDTTQQLTISTGGYWPFTITINGSAYSNKVDTRVLENWVKLGSHTVNGISHNDNGTKSITIAGSVTGPTGTSQAGKTTSGSKTVTLETIPRASTITSASAVTLGNACNVAWTPQAANFYYKLKFALGNWSHTTGVIYPASTAPYRYTAYTIPIDVANQITSSASATMTVTLSTYRDSGGTSQIGSADSETFQVTVPDNDSTKPKVEMAVSLVSDLASPFSGLYIQNLTKVKAVVSAEKKYGAEIKERQVVIGGGVYGSPYESGYLTQAGNVTITGKATDSRGYVGKTDATINVIPYAKPAIVPVDGEVGIVCVRCDENGYITDSGTYLKIKAKRTYSPVDQKNSCTFRYRCNNGSWTTISSDADVIDTKLANVVTDTTTAYTIEVGVIDDLGYDSSVTIIVPSDQVEFHLREGGDGAAFGEYAQEANVLAVSERWELKVKGDASVAGAMNVRNPQADTEALNRGYADSRYLSQTAADARYASALSAKDFVVDCTKNDTTGHYTKVWKSGMKESYHGREFFGSANPDLLGWAWRLTQSGFDGIMHFQLGDGATAPTTYCNGIIIGNGSNRCNVVVFGAFEVYTNLNQGDGWIGWRKISTTAVT